MGMSTGGGGAMSEINVTPLVDVMLVLLIIFMITAPMLNQGVNIELPDEIEAPQEPDPVNRDVYITVTKDLTITLKQGNEEAAPIATADVLDRLTRIAVADPETPIFLEAHPTVPYKKVAFLLAAAQTVGLSKVGMVFDVSEVE